MDPNTHSPFRNRTGATQRSPSQLEAYSHVPCRYFNSPTGCHRGKDCWFFHDIGSRNTSSNTSSDTTDPGSSPHLNGATGANPGSTAQPVCGICLESPTKFGLMVDCSHVFCLFCIRKWRSKEGKTEETVHEGMHKTCPLCRKHSPYIVPSNVFYEHDTAEKKAEIEKYLSNTAKIPCRHFTQSPTFSRFCPFGNDCHYSHSVDGRRYVFTQEELRKMKENRERRQRRNMQRNAEALEELFAQEMIFGMDEGEAFVWDILHGLIDHERREHRAFGGSPWEDGGSDPWTDGEDEDYEEEDEDEDEDEYEDEDDDEDEDSDSEGDSDDIPDLVDDDDDSIPGLVDDIPDDIPDLIDDDILGLIDDNIPDLVDDDLPDLVDDDLPDLVDDIPDSETRQDWGPSNAHPDEPSQPQVLLNGHRSSSTRPDWGPANVEQDTPNRPYVFLNPQSPASQRQPRSQSSPSAQGAPRLRSRPSPQVSYDIFGNHTPTPPSPSPSRPTSSIRNSFGFVPSSNIRRFTPPQHTPPPGPRRPRPPRTRNRDNSRPRSNPRVPRPPPPQDELGWEDEDGTTTTDGEISEREGQRIREREERGINAREWASRSVDLSFFQL